MRIFVTGANGFIGSAIVEELIGAGHQVTGLARSDASARSLLAAGARAHRGDIQTLESLRRGAASADGVIHTAFIHDISDARLRTRLKILMGGLPNGIVSRFGAAVTEVDRRAIETLGAALAGSGRPLVTAFPTMALTPELPGSEDNAADPRSPGGARVPSERETLALASRGVRASVVRLPPSVHGDGDGGLVPRLIGLARKTRVAAYVGEGLNRWPAVHRLDAARLFRLALESGAAGARYHAVAEDGVSFRAIAEVISRRLDAPLVSLRPPAAARHFSWLAPFVSNDNPVSSQLTRERLGWRPVQPSLLADLDRPEYFAPRTK